MYALFSGYPTACRTGSVLSDVWGSANKSAAFALRRKAVHVTVRYSYSDIRETARAPLIQDDGLPDVFTDKRHCEIGCLFRLVLCVLLDFEASRELCYRLKVKKKVTSPLCVNLNRYCEMRLKP